MSETAEVVVIGAGAVGASTAFHLARLGVTDVVLLERDTIASGSTGRAVGGIRCQFGDETNIRVCQRSLAAFQHFTELLAEIGVDADCGLRQPGYLILVTDPAHLEFFRDAIALQNRLGVPTRELAPDAVRALVPQLSLDGVIAAAYNPEDGRMLPEAIAQGYAAGAAALGVRVRQRTTVDGIAVEQGRVVAVDTPTGRIATSTVVCCAGVWSAPLARDVGVEVPVEGHRHHVVFSAEDGGLPDDMPFVSDYATGFYVTREVHGLVFGGNSSEFDDIVEPAVRRLPLLERLGIHSTWSGFYDMSPDHNAVVGEAPEVSRFLFATGFSGHGVMQSPAVGEHLAERVAGIAPSLDLMAFRRERFGDPDLQPERFVL
jgi:sarcosine oxidase subunit beta